jgi:hypothetical protein
VLATEMVIHRLALDSSGSTSNAFHDSIHQIKYQPLPAVRCHPIQVIDGRSSKLAADRAVIRSSRQQQASRVTRSLMILRGALPECLSNCRICSSTRHHHSASASIICASTFTVRIICETSCMSVVEQGKHTPHSYAAKAVRRCEKSSSLLEGQSEKLF